MEIFGVPSQAFFGQLLLGLINGSFYAVLSLGLAVIFGLLNIINFAHGAQYMLGAFAAWMGLNWLGINYWAALVLAPLAVGLLAVVIERTMLRHLYKLDHLYGLLLTFGLALVAEGVFKNFFGVSGESYEAPEILQGGVNLGFMYLPIYRAWVVVAALTVCAAAWYVIERTSLGATLRAATQRPDLVQALGINVPVLVTATYATGAALAAFAGVLAAPIQQVNPGLQPHHRGVCRGGDRRHGLHSGCHRHRAGAGHRRRPDQGLLPRSIGCGHLSDHGAGAACQTRWPVRQASLKDSI